MPKRQVLEALSGWSKSIVAGCPAWLPPGARAAQASQAAMPRALAMAPKSASVAGTTGWKLIATPCRNFANYVTLGLGVCRLICSNDR